jgi:oligopeptide/dipeptide ABC transporter ATP-binding protein
MLLDVAGLTVVFDRRGGPAVAVDDVSFAIDAGETLGLVGESGSGKSVTALSLVRLVERPGRITAGRVLFNGNDLLALPDERMQRVRGGQIGFIFQEPMTALNPVLSIGRHLSEALQVHRTLTRHDAHLEALRLLEAVRIPNASLRIRDYPHQLSGGMRQRVLIAMAIACKPSLLIADEPTTALDVTIQAEILDLLREMQQSLGLALLLVTHDFGVLAETADRIAVMYAGRIVEQGEVADIFKSPQHPYTRGLLASMPGRIRGQRLQAIEGHVPLLGALPSGCSFHPRCPDRFDPCAVTAPPAFVVGAGHTSRCYLHDGVTVHPSQVGEAPAAKSAVDPPPLGPTGPPAAN